MIKKEPKKQKQKTTEVAYKSYFQEIKDELKKLNGYQKKRWLSIP